MCGALLCAVLSGCGLGGGDESAGSEVLTIGTAVSTTTTTAPTSEVDDEVTDSGEFYRKLVENLEPAEDSTTSQPAADTSTTVPAAPYCLEMEKFVFESTQMFLAEDVPSTLERHRAVMTALDNVATTAPPPIAGPAREIHRLLVDVIPAAEAATSLESLRDVLKAPLLGHAAQIDSLLAEVIDSCDVNVTDRNLSTAEGLELLTRG